MPDQLVNLYYCPYCKQIREFGVKTTFDEGPNIGVRVLYCKTLKCRMMSQDRYLRKTREDWDKISKGLEAKT